MTTPLFEGFDTPAPIPYGPRQKPDGISADRWRTIRQAHAIEIGLHPLNLDNPVPLHPDTANNPDLTCGTCAHRIRAHGGNKTYAKCDISRVSHGAATDIRAWWPACTRWEEQTP